MKLGFLVNDVAKEKVEYTTPAWLRRPWPRVTRRGTSEATTSPTTLTSRSGPGPARAPADAGSGLEEFLEAVQAEDNEPERIAVRDLDILMLPE